MALIFDGFPDLAQANQFADEVGRTFGVLAAAYANVEEAADGTPSSGASVVLRAIYPHLLGPVVLVDRTLDERERRIEQLACEFQGHFVGS